jgi:hypothetical protein
LSQPYACHVPPRHWRSMCHRVTEPGAVAVS